MNTDSANEAKASFASAYTQDTPHDYFLHLGKLDYSICDETRPFCAAAANLVRGWDSRVRMLDIGCSYGINAAIVKHGILFAELARFFESSVPRESDAAHERVRDALSKNGRSVEMESVGLDVSAPAVGFARRAGLLDHGIVADLERGPDTLSREDRDWIRGVNLIVATGAIGYVTDRTLSAVLGTMGAQASNAIVLLTVLRVFDSDPIVQALRQHGLETAAIPRVLLPQRRFHGDGEQNRIVQVLRERGLDPEPEKAGRHYARILVAARGDRLSRVLGVLNEIAGSRLTLRPEPDRALPKGSCGPTVSVGHAV